MFRVLLIAVVLCFSALVEAQPVPPSAQVTAEAVKANPAPVPNVTLPPPPPITEPKKAASPLSQPLKPAEKVSAEGGGKSPEQAGEANQKTAAPSSPPGDRASSSPVAPQPGTESSQKGTSKPETVTGTSPPGPKEPQIGLEKTQGETPPPECAPEEAPSDATDSPFGQEETGKGPSAWLKTLDVLVVRPFAVVGSTVSTAAYLAISPLAFVMGLGESAARVMVEAPWRFTAFRYVGQFNHYVDEEPIMGVWDF